MTEGDVLSMLQHRDNRRQLADLLDWAENLPSMFAWPTTLRGLRIEAFTESDRYVVRAELPGLDPANDSRVEVANRMMTIAATREEEAYERGHTEFHYGAVTRHVMLPDGADETAVKAKYAAGILEVTVPISPHRSDSRCGGRSVGRPCG